MAVPLGWEQIQRDMHIDDRSVVVLGLTPRDPLSNKTTSERFHLLRFALPRLVHLATSV